MAAATSGPGTFAGFISSLSQDQLAALADELQEARERGASLPTTANRNDTKAVKPRDEARFTKIIKSSRPAPVGTRLRNACLARQAEIIPTLKRKLRPLNSFIAFRSYYSVIFAGLTQKVKSGLMRHLWEGDLSKGKWSLLAKAFTEVRTNGVSLENFLAATAPLIGVVAPNEYLETMGFAILDNSKGGKDLVKTEDPLLEEFDLTTNLSVEDIVEHCYDCGLCLRSKPTGANPEAAMTMSFAVQPTNIGKTRSKPQGDMGEEMKLNEPDEVAFNQVTDSLGERFDLNGAVFGGFDQMPALPHDLLVADQSRAFDSFIHLPLDIHFHPSATQPILGYDPNLIQSNFDPFDLSEFVNADG